MNISSAILQTRPEHADEVLAALDALPGVDIHARTPAGQFVLTIEDHDSAASADTYVRLHALRHVLSVDMIYQYGEASCSGESLP